VMRGDQRLQVVDARPRNYVSRNPDTMPRAVWRDPERVDDWCAELSLKTQRATARGRSPLIYLVAGARNHRKRLASPSR
jgi:hypothetical protein